MFNICIVGMGYVGCANALLLSQNSRVVIVDISQDKVEDFNRKILPVRDSLGEEFLKNESLNIRASSNLGDSIKGADYVILALPTDYDEKSKTFNTSALDEVAEFVLSENDNALVIIKSTIPIGYVENLREKMNTKRVVFSPEFLREGHALEDNLYPSRIIIGDDSEKATAYFLGGIVNFTLNKIYTFPKGHRRSHQEARTFVVIAIIGLVLTNLFALFFLYISINILDILISPKLIEIYSHIVAVGLVAIYSFLGHKHLTFKGGIRKYFSKGKLQ